jgi:hypothetical protein
MMSGSMPACFVMEQLSGPAHAGLDLVDDQQQAVLLGQRAQLLQELIGCRPDAGFALDRLQHHGDRVVRDQRLHRIEVVELGFPEARYFRLEQRLERLLARRRHGGERAAVKAAFEGDDFERAVLVFRAVFRASLMAPSLASAPELAKNT